MTAYKDVYARRGAPSAPYSVDDENTRDERLGDLHQFRGYFLEGLGKVTTTPTPPSATPKYRLKSLENRSSE